MHVLLHSLPPTQHRPVPLLETPGHSQASLGQSLVGSLLLSPGSWCTQGSVWALQESIFPVLCKFWQLFDGVNGDLLQEESCCTQVCCTQSPIPEAVHWFPPYQVAVAYLLLPQLFVTVHISPTAQRVPAVSSLWGFFGSHSQASLSNYIHRCLLSDLINIL